MTAFINRPYMQRWYRAALSGGPGSLAAQDLHGETDGLALSFTDDFFHSSTGHYGSARVKDTGTPGNNYNSHPFGLLSYPGASKKWVRGPNGLWFLSDFANDLPFEWDESGKLLGIRVEERRLSLARRSRRLDDASHWTATNVSTSAVQGVDGVTGSATRITATANNGTILGATNTSAEAARRFAPFVRRVAGTGNLEWTLDGGSTWTAFTGITSAFDRKDVGATVANPQIGFRIASSGDEFDIDFANGETGAFSTSPMESGDAQFDRAADAITLATSAFPTGAEMSMFVVFSSDTPLEESAVRCGAAIGYGSSSNVFPIFKLTDDIALQLRVGVNTQGGVTVSNVLNQVSQVVKAVASVADDNFRLTVDGTDGTADTSGSMLDMTGLSLQVGRRAVNNEICGHVREIMVLPRLMSDVERAALTA